MRMHRTYFTARHQLKKEAKSLANFPGHERENTRCPNCGKIVIGRFGYGVRNWNLDGENRCKVCGQRIPIVGSLTGTLQRNVMRR